MQTPATWTLNVRGLDWLNAEADRWFGIVAGTTTTQDRADAVAYLNAVIAERDQRLGDYAGGFLSTVGGGLTAPFEMFGGSAGEGAAGLGAGISETVSITAGQVGRSLSSVAMIAALALLVVGTIYLHKKGAI